MNISARIIGDSSVRLWSLSSRERITRQLKSLKIPLVENGSDSLQQRGNNADKWLLIRCDFLFELRTFQSVLMKDDFLLVDDEHRQIALALVSADKVEQVADIMALQFAAAAVAGQEQEGDELLATLPSELTQADRSSLSVIDKSLRRAAPPLLAPLSAESASALEDQLYGNSYKGVTDLVTKWAWPRLAKHIVRFCANRAITPNQVTSVGFVLVIIAGILFYHGHFGLGLLAGWIMTLLDTVDGKLARVRVESSKLGNVFDHGIDLIHPPFWYMVWAMGLVGLGQEFNLGLVTVLIFVGYIVGRLAELAFQTFCGTSIFVWRPFDSWFRLITARRNPCMIILTVCLLVSTPLAGLWGVVIWTLVTTAVLWVRVVQGVKSREGSKPLTSWLAEAGAGERYATSYPVFSSTRSAYKA